MCYPNVYHMIAALNKALQKNIAGLKEQMKLIDKEKAHYERKLADANKNVDSELIRDLRKRRKNSKKSFFHLILFLGG